jgi:hypothetical protein
MQLSSCSHPLHRVSPVTATDQWYDHKSRTGQCKVVLVETIVSRCAALDVHKDTVMGCVRVPDGEGGRAREVREFRIFTVGLRALRAWLVGHGVTQVAMEATGVYWKPVWHVLESEPTWQLLLADAQHVKNLPGRKTDVADSVWLAQLLECGLLRGSFVPPRAPDDVVTCICEARGVGRTQTIETDETVSCDVRFGAETQWTALVRRCVSLGHG